jgi:Methyltransferase FkbM domain
VFSLATANSIGLRWNIFSTARRQRGQEAVSIQSMASLVEHLPAPILLKMDIEGSEVELLNCRAEWIDKVGYIMVEFHDIVQEKKWLKVLAEEGWKPEKHFDTWHFSITGCNQ